MEKLRNYLKDYFTITTREANGVMVFFVVIIVLLALPWIYRWYLNKTSADQPMIEELVLLEQVKTAHDAAYSLYTDSTYRTESTPHAIITFNPNSASEKKLRQAGIPAYLAKRIQKYRAAGGQFKVKSDLKKIYGFPEDLYYNLSASILLPDSMIRSLHQKNFQTKPEEQTSRTESKKQKLDINNASTEDLKKVYGIGNVLSERIKKFRDALGGFVKAEQFYEVYGLDSATVERMIRRFDITKDFVPRKIFINTLPAEEIQKHPYISGKASEVLVRYRKEHGNFRGKADLEKIKTFTPEALARLYPYLHFDTNKTGHLTE